MKTDLLEDEGLGVSTAISEPPSDAQNAKALRARFMHPKICRRTLFVTAALAITVTSSYLFFRGQVSTDDAQVDGHLASIAAKVNGNVSEVLVDDNQTVKMGQALVRLDERDYQIKVDQAHAALAVVEAQARSAAVFLPMVAETTSSATSGSKAQVNSARAELERSRGAYQQAATADLEYARANAEAKEAAFDKARSDLARMKPLATKAEISQLQLDAYAASARIAENEWKAATQRLLAAQSEQQIRKSALNGAQAQLERAGASLSQTRSSEKQVAVSAAAKQQAEASVAKAKADLSAAELQLSYCTITAPFDGVVTRKTAESGQIVQPGQQLLVVVPLNKVWVTANFKETQLAHVRPGQKAEIKVDMYGKKFRAVVDSLASTTGARTSLLPPENATGNYVKVVQRVPVKILVEPESGSEVLRPGMNVDVTIFTR